MTAMTRHAEYRRQSRGVPSEILSVVLSCADREVPCGGGCMALEIGAGRMEEIRKLYGPAAERARNVILVTNRNGEIVTVLRANSRKAARRYRKGLN